jgi:hypothetical protein
MAFLPLTVSALSPVTARMQTRYRLAARKQREQLENHVAIGASEKRLTYNLAYCSKAARWLLNPKK